MLRQAKDSYAHLPHSTQDCARSCHRHHRHFCWSRCAERNRSRRQSKSAFALGRASRRANRRALYLLSSRRLAARHRGLRLLLRPQAFRHRSHALRRLPGRLPAIRRRGRGRRARCRQLPRHWKSRSRRLRRANPPRAGASQIHDRQHVVQSGLLRAELGSRRSGRGLAQGAPRGRHRARPHACAIATPSARG